MAPPSALISYGFQARVMYVEPESELVVVTMGQTEGNSLWDGGCSYDEGYTITLMVHAWQNATTPDPALKHAYDAAAARRAADSAEIAAAGRVGEWVLERHGERSSTAAARTTVARPPSSRPAQLGKQAPPTGSCFCFCPPGEGFGTCANVYDNSTHCEIFSQSLESMFTLKSAHDALLGVLYLLFILNNFVASIVLFFIYKVL